MVRVAVSMARAVRAMRAPKLLAGAFRQGDGDGIADLDLLRIGLRHVDVQAQRVDLRDREQRLSRSAIAGIDEIAHVDIAPGHHAVERRDDAG